MKDFPDCDGLTRCDDHDGLASAMHIPAGRKKIDAPPLDACRDMCDSLAELQIRRKFYINAINRSDNALKALVRRGLGWHWDMNEAERTKLNNRAARIVAALLNGKEVKADDEGIAQAVAADIEVARLSRDPLVKQRHQIELDMKRQVRTLPVYPWAKSVRGFGELGLAVIIAEAGDLTNYPNPAKVWKRLGLAPYQGKAASTWRVPKWRDRALESEEWSELGYSPARLGQVYGCVTESLIKQNNDTYRAVYDFEKAKFLARETTPMHAHKHALRVMTKALVLDLWRVWHGYEPRQRECGEGHEAHDIPYTVALADIIDLE